MRGGNMVGGRGERGGVWGEDWIGEGGSKRGWSRQHAVSVFVDIFFQSDKSEQI